MEEEKVAPYGLVRARDDVLTALAESFNYSAPRHIWIRGTILSEPAVALAE